MVCVDPNGKTLPPGLNPTEDPDAGADRRAAVALGGADVGGLNFGFEGDLQVYTIPTLGNLGLFLLAGLLLVVAMRRAAGSAVG